MYGSNFRVTGSLKMVQIPSTDYIGVEWVGTERKFLVLIVDQFRIGVFNWGGAIVEIYERKVLLDGILEFEMHIKGSALLGDSSWARALALRDVLGMF